MDLVLIVTLLVGELAMVTAVGKFGGEGDRYVSLPLGEISLSASEASVAPASAESSLGRFLCC